MNLIGRGDAVSEVAVELRRVEAEREARRRACGTADTPRGSDNARPACAAMPPPSLYERERFIQSFLRDERGVGERNRSTDR